VYVYDVVVKSSRSLSHLPESLLFTQITFCEVCQPTFSSDMAQRIRGFTTMRYINLRFTYLLTYLLTYSSHDSMLCVCVCVTCEEDDVDAADVRYIHHFMRRSHVLPVQLRAVDRLRRSVQIQ